MPPLTTLVKAAFLKCQHDKVGRLAASLAYYALISIAPLSILTTAAAGSIFGGRATEGRLAAEIQGFVSPLGAVLIEGILKQAHRPGPGILASFLGFAILLFGASGVFVELRDALNTIWAASPQSDEGFSGMVKGQLLSFAMVVGAGFGLVLLLAGDAVVEMTAKRFAPLLPTSPSILRVVSFGFSLAFATVIFGVVYKILPDVSIPWSDVWIGAIATSLLFTIGKALIGFYLGSTSFASAYGAAGSLVLFLIWLYYSAHVFYFGAEFTCIYSREHRLPDKSALHRAAA